MIAKTRRVTSCLHTDITTAEGGRPALTWHFDQDLLRAEAAVDGWYALLTTLTPEQADPSDVLRRHKGQGAVERRYSDFKGPLAVTPVFVQDNKRVAALITVICLALLLFCLIERQVRRALGGDQKTQGIYPGQETRGTECPGPLLAPPGGDPLLGHRELVDETKSGRRRIAWAGL